MAATLPAKPDLVAVEESGDPDLGDLRVSVQEVLWQRFDDLVEESVLFIDSLSGVDEVIRDDAHIILIWTGVLSMKEMAGSLRRWWADRLTAISTPG